MVHSKDLQMESKQFEQLVRWFDEEREAFKAKGAKDEILRESAFLELVLYTVMAKHSDEIRADPEFLAALEERILPETHGEPGEI
jgi:hypothetical protein